MIHAALLLLMLGALTTVTPFHHQPEAQHPKSSAIHNNAGRLSHLWVKSRHDGANLRCLLYPQKRTCIPRKICPAIVKKSSPGAHRENPLAKLSKNPDFEFPLNRTATC
jgi:hypothetical protein